MPSSVPRISGVALDFVSSLFRSSVSGPPLRRALGALVVEKKLAGIDFAAEGSPAPLYMPPAYRRPDR